MDHGIFQRREIKFLVDSRQRAILEQAFRGRTVYGKTKERRISPLPKWYPTFDQ